MTATFTTDERVSLLLKKNFGKGSTDPELAFYSEPSVSNSRQAVFLSQIYSQEIPSTRPQTGWETGTDNTNLDSFISSMSNGDRIQHSTHPIEYIHKAQCSIVTTGNNITYNVMDGGVNLLQHSVPFGLDPAGGYAIKLYRSNGTTQIVDGEGDWVVQPEHGFVIFFQYSTVSSYVNGTTSQPLLSFFRYTGNFGLSSFTSLWTDSTNEIYPTNLSKTICIGRNTTSSAGTYDLEVNGIAKFHDRVEANELVCVSDARLKENIETIRDPMYILEGLTGVKFKWKNNKKPSAGLLAQDVQKMLPESVSTIVEDGNRVLGVKYNHIVGVLVQAVKQQQQQINQLKLKIDKLCSTIEKMCKFV